MFSNAFLILYFVNKAILACHYNKLNILLHPPGDFDWGASVCPPVCLFVYVIIPEVVNGSFLNLLVGKATPKE